MKFIKVYDSGNPVHNTTIAVCDGCRLEVLEQIPDGMHDLYDMWSANIGQSSTSAVALGTQPAGLNEEGLLRALASNYKTGFGIARFLQENGIAVQHQDSEYSPPPAWTLSQPDGERATEIQIDPPPANSESDLSSSEEAVRDATLALQLNSGNAVALRKRAEAYLMLNRFDEAIHDAVRALELEPDNAFALRTRAEACRMTNRLDEAIRDATRALALEPGHAFALNTLTQAKKVLSVRSTVPRTKRKVAGDIVVLVDISSSMASAIDAIRSAWASFVRQLLDSTATEGPRVDLRLKVVGYAMSEDGTQPVIQSNPFVHNEIAAFDAQFANLKTVPTNHSPRPLLDALWQTISVGSMPGMSDAPDPAKWRDHKAARRIIAIYSDTPFREEVHIQEARGAIVEDAIRLVMMNRVALQIFAPEHECYMKLAEADRADCEFGNIIELLQKSDWQKRVMIEMVVRIIRDPPFGLQEC